MHEQDITEEMEMMKRTTLAVLMTLSLITILSAEPIVSDFETGTDDWRVIDMNCTGTVDSVYGTYGVTFVESGGCAGGYIEGSDPSNNCFYFDAPANFLGDKSPYLGGRLTFCIRSSMTNWPDGNLVVLAGAGLVVVAEIKPFPTADWQRITIPLGACYFRKGNKDGTTVLPEELMAVLADLTSLRISGEYGSIVAETTGLDSVMLIPPPFGDIDSECGVGLGDLTILAGYWLQTPAEQTADLYPDCRIDLQDFAVIAELWLSDDGCSPE
jgi:hypothetical protein